MKNNCEQNYQNLFDCNSAENNQKELFNISYKYEDYLTNFRFDEIKGKGNYLFNELLFKNKFLPYEEIINEENIELNDNSNYKFIEYEESKPINIEFPFERKNKKLEILDSKTKDEELVKSSKNFEKSKKEKKLKKNSKNNKNSDICLHKNIFNVFNLFNPKEENEKSLIIRKYINDVILESQVKKPIMEIKSRFPIDNEHPKKIWKKRKRKQNSDDIRKKIKSRFLKSLRNRLNEKLIKAKSKCFFDFLPQCFICSISKKTNNSTILNMTLKELISTDFFNLYYKETYRKKIHDIMPKKERICPDTKKFINNVKVLKYLENNKEISKNSNFDVICNMTFRDLFNEYLKSKEFEDDILKLKIEGKEDKNYINDYIIKAFNYINYFLK